MALGVRHSREKKPERPPQLFGRRRCQKELLSFASQGYPKDSTTPDTTRKGSFVLKVAAAKSEEWFLKGETTDKAVTMVIFEVVSYETSAENIK